MADRSYLSIGEVLALLKEEFPDVTISKIRFLESQGLLDPERTPSGYRKFYEADVERLRWILQQQREHFLPLKVIKGRLGVEGEDDDDPVAEPSAQQPAGPVSPPEAPLPPQPAPVTSPRPLPVPPPLPTKSAAPAGGAAVNLTLEELSSASDLPADKVRELEKFGMLTSRTVAGTAYYDDEALAVAGLAAGFMRFGVEARHLRMYKNAAEREVGFFEQVVMPLLKQRNPDSRRQAVETLGQLTALGEGLRAALLRQALRDHTL